MIASQHLVETIKAQNVRAGDIVVSIDDFFVGNDDLGSIGCNLGDNHPGIAAFYKMLQSIRAKPKVQDVLIRICEFDEPDSWPYADTAYVLASATSDEVKEWVRPLLPTEVYAEWMYGLPPKAPQLNAGVTPYSVWWD